MSDLLRALAEPLEREGPQMFASWDAALFRDVCDRPARVLAKRLRGVDGAERALGAYLRLAAEAIGCGYLDRAGFDALLARGGGLGADVGRDSASAGPSAPSFLALLWLVLVPAKLGAAEGDRVALLADLWNLAEGVRFAPAWIDRYVTASAAGLGDLRETEPFLVRVLEPALVPARAARFDGPFSLAVLDARALDDDFLPGEMHLAAPAVLCVHDRSRAAVRAGVFLKPDRRSHFLGLMPCLGKGPDDGLPAGAAPGEVVVGGGAARIGGRRVRVPMLRRAHGAVVAPSGFVVASAVDSQRLWILESP